MAKTTADGAEGSYVDGSVFQRVLGRPSRVKLIEVFLGKHYVELSAAQVADLAGVDVSTFHRNVDVLLDLGVVEATRTVGGAQLYRLNVDHPVSKALGKARSELLSFVDASGRTVGDGDRTGSTPVVDEPGAET